MNGRLSSFNAFVASYKTEMCEYRNHCMKKEHCYFAHNEDELRKGFCLKYYNTGRCEREDCRFRHGQTLPDFPSWLRQSYDSLCYKERRSRSRTPERVRRPSRSRSPPVRYTRERSRSPADNRIDGLRQDLEATRASVAVLQRDVAALTNTNAELINVVRCLVQNSVGHHPPQQLHPPQQQIQPDYISALIATINSKK